MNRLLEKYEAAVTYVLIALYVVINSYCRSNFGTTDYRSALAVTAFSVVLVGNIIGSGRRIYYGLTKVKNTKAYLFFIPLVCIVSVNLWNGINIENTQREIIFHTISMINAGFLEEIIFRGFLFKMMEKDNLKSAMVVSSLTFGIGHIVNLLSGADVVQTLIQICYATTIGLLFVTIFHKSKSLVPCILAHAAINVLSLFNGENEAVFYLASAFLVVVPLAYTYYINRNVKEAVV